MRKLHYAILSKQRSTESCIYFNRQNLIWCEGNEQKKKQEKSFDLVFFMWTSYCTSRKHKIRYHFGDSTRHLQEFWPLIYTLPATTAINGSPDDRSVHYNPTYCHVKEKTQRFSIECWGLHVILSEKREKRTALQILTALSVLLTYTLVPWSPATPSFYYRETSW